MKNFLKNNWFYCLMLLLVIARFTNIFVINLVSGESMIPTFKDGELLVGTCLKGNLERGDIVVANSPDGRLVIKRVIGLPGEHIVIENGSLYADDVLIKEDYLEPRNNMYSKTNKVEYTLSKGQYLIAGDNRDNSYDGRSYGPLSGDAIVQKILFRLT